MLDNRLTDEEKTWRNRNLVPSINGENIRDFRENNNYKEIYTYD